MQVTGDVAVATAIFHTESAEVNCDLCNVLVKLTLEYRMPQSKENKLKWTP